MSEAPEGGGLALSFIVQTSDIPIFVNKRTSMPHYLFVYGTLMQKCRPNAWAAFLHTNAQYAGEASVEGLLYKVAYYPGLVRGEGVVYGELFELRDPEKVFRLLDEYEDYLPDDPDRSLYLRVLAWVTLTETGEKKESWLYYYNQPVTDFMPYENGRFTEE
jgi:gamma-glutamylcyclotransferase (GGCT)/AIG2-like uncharacterized protein YtfP